MKLILSCLLFSVFLCLFKESSAERKTKCRPGETWKEECHTCKCSTDGRPVCSRELCKGQGVKMVLPPIRTKREAVTCVEGEVWKDDCNTCHCSLGTPACTRMRCPPKINERSNYECVPGTSWKEDCNNCFCTSEGVAGCTRKLCIHTPPRT